MQRLDKIKSLASLFILAANAHAQTQGTSTHFEFDGTVTSRIAVIQSQIDGVVRNVIFEPGQKVEKGDMLFQLDSTMAQLHASIIQERLRSIHSERERLTQSRRADPFGTPRAKNMPMELAGRLRNLETEQKITTNELKIANLEISFAEIRAPISGRIGRTTLTAGSVVNAAKPMVTIHSTDPLYVTFRVEQVRFLQLLKQFGGKEKLADVIAEIKLDGSEFDYKGKLDWIDTHFDLKTNTIQCRVVMTNSNEQVLPGMAATIRFPAAEE